MQIVQRIEGELSRRAAEPAGNGQDGGIVDGPRIVGFRLLAGRARAFARALAAEGVRPGDRVAVFLDHKLEQIVALYGAWYAGAIAVPVNGALKTQQVAHIVAHSGCAAFVSEPRKLATLEPEALGGARVLELASCDALLPAPNAPHERERKGGAEPAAILYTSGSTGRPKGILISHDNLLAGTRIVSSYLGIKSSERILSVLPFSFDYGLNQLLTAVHRGCTLVLQRSHFPADVLRTLAEQRITALAGVPPLWIQLMERMPPRKGDELPHLRYITNSGGTFPVQLVRRYRERWPHVRIFLMYGLSEAFRSTFLPPEELDAHPDSIGRAIPECEVLVVDAEGRICAHGESGELVHRGPTVALGYWNDPEATARVWRPDPEDPSSPRKVVHSGDLVRRDERGLLYFVARRDQMLKSYGYRISPEEVEEQLYASPLVAEVVVEGRPDAVAGAAIVAHVIPSDPATFDPNALLEFCRARMPAYMVPKAIEVHASLPRTASGKFDRKALVG